jgi:sRNA-binding carbon storage regulator CsrA
MVGDGAVLVSDINGGQVKLTFQFAREVNIVRGSIAEPNDAARDCVESMLRAGRSPEQQRAARRERRARWEARSDERSA